MDHIHVR
jgi:hypothetical protein